MRCTRCGEDKDGAAFYRHRRDGHRQPCKDCTREERRNPRIKAMRRAYKRKRYKTRMREDLEYRRKMDSAKYRRLKSRMLTDSEYRSKVLARKALRYAVSRGRVVKPVACEGCGVVGVLHGHHDDYAKPLSVVWLCGGCHREAHGQERGGSYASPSS